MGLGRKHTGWSMHCSPDTPPARREDEQISEGQTEEIAFSFLWDEELPHSQALSPCGSTDFTSLSAPARHQAQSPSPCPPPAVGVKSFMEELKNVDLISAYLCLFSLLSWGYCCCQHGFFLLYMR